jgi:hypothetical protein
MRVGLVFGTRKGLFAWITRLWLRSPWSHGGVLIQASEGNFLRVYESTKKRGVDTNSMLDFERRYPKNSIYWFDVPSPYAGQAWLEQQIGKPYDSSALWAFVIPGRRWDDAGQWYCYELCAGFLRAAGVHVPDKKAITDSDLIKIVADHKAGQGQSSLHGSLQRK